MTAHVSHRLRDLFLTPDATAPAVRVTDRTIPATLGVLAAGRDGDVAATALALAAARAHRARCAVVCRWDGRAGEVTGGAAGGAASASAAPSIVARRLAERLARRGMLAAARGRVVRVALPSSPAEARAATERTLAAVDAIPLVLLVAGPRPPELDPVLAVLDRLVVVPSSDAPSGLTDLAITAAAALGRSASCLALPDSPLAWLVSATGRSLSPRLRAAAAAALGGGDG